jgi:hypothetical protein
LEDYDPDQAEKLDVDTLWEFEPELEFLNNWNSCHEEIVEREQREQREQRKRRRIA